MEKKGREPAFPTLEETSSSFGGKYWNNTFGMSKRFFAACMAMQGILAKGDLTFAESIVTRAYKIADELLEQEDK